MGVPVSDSSCRFFQIGLGQRDGLSDLGIPGLDEYSRDPVLAASWPDSSPHQYIDVLDLLQLMGIFSGDTVGSHTRSMESRSRT